MRSIRMRVALLAMLITLAFCVMSVLIHSALIRAKFAKFAGDIRDSALIKAAFKGQTTIVKALLVIGADVNMRYEDPSGRIVDGWTKDDFTPLIAAAEGGHTATVKALLDKGAAVNAEESHGWRALLYAAQRGDTAIVEALLAKGADVNVADSSVQDKTLPWVVFGDGESRR